jgi:hypothetical protein
MKSITSKLVVGMLASLAATGMTGGAAFAASFSGTEGYSSHANVVAQPISETRDKAVDTIRERQRQAGDMMKHPQSVTYKITGRVSYARAAAANVAREAQRQALEVLGKTH